MIEKTYKYIVKLSNISPWFYIAAVAVAIAVGLISRKVRLGILVGYCLIIFSIAVLSRKSGNHTNNFLLFHTYRHGLTDQILANIVFFIPIGIFLGSFGWKYIPVGSGFSVLIELCQLILNRGMFDVDDVLNNTAGILIGATFFFFFRWVYRCTRR